VPEGANIHDKSYYTSNKDHFYRALEGISLHVHAHNVGELAHSAGMDYNTYFEVFQADLLFLLGLQS
jgi:hypothetical protein